MLSPGAMTDEAFVERALLHVTWIVCGACLSHLSWARGLGGVGPSGSGAGFCVFDELVLDAVDVSGDFGGAESGVFGFQPVSRVFVAGV